MPVLVGRDNQGCFAQWTSQGHKYYYKCSNAIARKNARKRAINQGISIGEYSIEKISFDYDDTLTRATIKEKAKRYIKNGVDVYVISARHNEEVMWPTTDALGISRTRVFATGSNTNKVEKIKALGITKHYDNNENVIKKLGNIGELVKFSIHEMFSQFIKFIGPDSYNDYGVVKKL